MSYFMDYGPDWPPAPADEPAEEPLPVAMTLAQKCGIAVVFYALVWAFVALLIHLHEPHPLLIFRN